MTGILAMRNQECLSSDLVFAGRDVGMEEKMDIYPYFKSVVDADRCPVVICNLAHEIIYMNPAAEARYIRSGGGKLVGKSLLDCHGEGACQMIRKVVEWFEQDVGHNLIYTFRNEQENKDVYMAALRAEDGTLIGYYEKHEYRDVETMSLYDFR